MKTYEYNGKKYQRVKSECKCLGCDFLDEETGDCLAPMPSELGTDCMEITKGGDTQHYQFKEVKPTIDKMATDQPVAPLTRERVIEVLKKYQQIRYKENETAYGVWDIYYKSIASELCDAGQTEERTPDLCCGIYDKKVDAVQSDNRDKIISKMEELIKHLELPISEQDYFWGRIKLKLESELSELRNNQ